MALLPSVSITKEDNTVYTHECQNLSLIHPPIITRTAATPMATPQGSPNDGCGGAKDLRNNLAVQRAFSVGPKAIRTGDKVRIRDVRRSDECDQSPSFKR